MDFAGVLNDKITAFTAGIAGLAPAGAGLSLTIITLALIFSPAAREWAAENKQLATPVIFGLIVISLIPAFVAAIG
jgi:hypothetical protein